VDSWPQAMTGPSGLCYIDDRLSVVIVEVADSDVYAPLQLDKLERAISVVLQSVYGPLTVSSNGISIATKQVSDTERRVWFGGWLTYCLLADWSSCRKKEGREGYCARYSSLMCASLCWQ
jgi:hypothetical protein